MAASAMRWTGPVREITLHGALSELRPDPLRMDVRTAAEALVALESQVPGFHRSLARHRHGIRIEAGGRLVSADWLDFPLDDGQDLHIMPAVSGQTGLEIAAIVAAVIALGAAAYAIVNTPKGGWRRAWLDAV